MRELLQLGTSGVSERLTSFISHSFRKVRQAAYHPIAAGMLQCSTRAEGADAFLTAALQPWLRRAILQGGRR